MIFCPEVCEMMNKNYIYYNINVEGIELKKFYFI